MVEVEETAVEKSTNQFNIQRLNEIIKSQLKHLLLPEDFVSAKLLQSYQLNPKPKDEPLNLKHFFSEENQPSVRFRNVYHKSQEEREIFLPPNSYPANLNALNSLPKEKLLLDYRQQEKLEDCDKFTKFSKRSVGKGKLTKRKAISVDSAKRIVSKIFEVLLVDLFLLPFVPFILLLVAINVLFRFMVSIYLRIVTKGKVQLMRGEDAFWAYECPGNPGNFNSLYVIEGDCNLAKIRQKLSSRWVERTDKGGKKMFNKLKLKAVQRYGYFAWEYHDSFKIEDHVRYLQPSRPEVPISETELFEEITKIYDNILPESKPQWEILVIPHYVYTKTPSYSRKNRYALLFRIHHSIMDGLSAAQALRLVVADNVVDAGIDPMRPLKVPLWQTLAAYILGLFLAGPYILRWLYSGRDNNAFNGPVLTGPKHLGWSRPIRLDAMKKMKTFTKTSVTPLFLSAIGGAFRSLAVKKGLPIPEKVTAATCAAMIPYPNFKAQNRFCVLFYPADAKEKDPLRRATVAQRSFEMRLVGAAEVIMAYWIVKVGGLLPAEVMNLLQDQMCTGSVLLSNLPGPMTTAQIFGGDPIEDMVGWSPIRNRIGVAMCMFGYNGRIRANVVADSTVFPDKSYLDIFMREFENEIIKLGDICGLTEENCFVSSNFT